MKKPQRQTRNVSQWSQNRNSLHHSAFWFQVLKLILTSCHGTGPRNQGCCHHLWVLLKLLWAPKSISENSSITMPRLSAELSDDRNNGPSSVPLPSYHLVIMCVSNSCLSYSCLFLLPGQCCFSDGLASVCLRSWSRMIPFDLHSFTCVYGYVYFSCLSQFRSILGLSYCTEEKTVTGTSIRFLNRRLSFATHQSCDLRQFSYLLGVYFIIIK